MVQRCISLNSSSSFEVGKQKEVEVKVVWSWSFKSCLSVLSLQTKKKKESNPGLIYSPSHWWWQSRLWLQFQKNKTDPFFDNPNLFVFSFLKKKRLFTEKLLKLGVGLIQLSRVSCSLLISRLYKTRKEQFCHSKERRMSLTPPSYRGNTRGLLLRSNNRDSSEGLMHVRSQTHTASCSLRVSDCTAEAWKESWWDSKKRGERDNRKAEVRFRSGWWQLGSSGDKRLYSDLWGVWTRPIVLLWAHGFHFISPLIPVHQSGEDQS